MNMVLAEFIIAAFGLPIDFTASFYHGWKMGKTLCHITGFILTTTGMYDYLLIMDCVYRGSSHSVQDCPKKNSELHCVNHTINLHYANPLIHLV